MKTEVHIPLRNGETLGGTYTSPEGAGGLVLFAHGSGSSRHSPRNQFVARSLNEAGFQTLLFDLLTAPEEAVDLRSREYRFNINLLANRLLTATRWAAEHDSQHRPMGYFGASTGAAAALIAAAEPGNGIAAVVSRGGRPDLAGNALPRVSAPTLLIVGGEDDVVIELNESARQQMRGTVEVEIVPGATHLFEEPGTLDHVARSAGEWFRAHFAAGAKTQPNLVT